MNDEDEGMAMHLAEAAALGKAWIDYSGDEQIEEMARGMEYDQPCSLCGGPVTGYGHNPEPLKPFEERCCDNCNDTQVIPARLGRMSRGHSTHEVFDYSGVAEALQVGGQVGKVLVERELLRDALRQVLALFTHEDGFEFHPAVVHAREVLGE